MSSTWFSRFRLIFEMPTVQLETKPLDKNTIALKRKGGHRTNKYFTSTAHFQVLKTFLQQFLENSKSFRYLIGAAKNVKVQR